MLRISNIFLLTLFMTLLAPLSPEARTIGGRRTLKPAAGKIKPAAGKISTTRARVRRPPRQGVWIKRGKRIVKVPIKTAEKKFGIKWTRLQQLAVGLTEKGLPGYSDGPGSVDLNNLDAPQYVAPQYRPTASDRRAMIGRTAGVYVGKVSKTVGNGLFAKGTIREGSVIGEYAGVVRMENFGNKAKDHANGYTFVYDPFQHFPFLIDAQKQGNYMRFANHSAKHANAKPRMVFDEPHNRWHVLLVATKKITRGQQVLFNYSNQYDWSRFGIKEPTNLKP